MFFLGESVGIQMVAMFLFWYFQVYFFNSLGKMTCKLIAYITFFLQEVG